MTHSQRLQVLRDTRTAVSRTVDALRRNLARSVADRAQVDPRLAPAHQQVERGAALTRAKERAAAILSAETPHERIATAERLGAVFRDAKQYISLARFTRPTPAAAPDAPPAERTAVDAREALEAQTTQMHVLLSQRASVDQLEADAADAIGASALAKLGVIVRELGFRVSNGNDSARQCLGQIMSAVERAMESWPEVTEARDILADLRELGSYVDTLTGRSLEDGEDLSVRWEAARRISQQGGRGGQVTPDGRLYVGAVPTEDPALILARDA